MQKTKTLLCMQVIGNYALILNLLKLDNDSLVELLYSLCCLIFTVKLL